MTAPTRSGRSLSRGAGDGRRAAPVRHVHLGLGNFFRAHQAWYTDRAPDAAQWGIAAFTGRSSALSTALSAQDGLYTLVTRTGNGDRFDVVSSVSAAHAAAEHESWLRYLATPEVRLVSLTVTEAGYQRDAKGGLATNSPAVQRDLAALRTDLTAPVSTAPARLVAGMLARRRADAGPLTIIPCDNLPENGPSLARVIAELGTAVDPSLVPWIADSISYATTVVDRITPQTKDEDLIVVRDRTGVADVAPVVTEPFTEWVLSGSFRAGRPAWDAAGAVFTDDVTPFEQRKLWLLNGAHSLLAYAGSIRGHRTVAQAMSDQRCRGWLEQWWDEASAHLSLSAAEISDYRASLVERFENYRIQHLLAQIAADGSEKVRVRILPVLLAERAAGRIPAGAICVLAAWVCHLRGSGAAINDPRAEELTIRVAGAPVDAVRMVLAWLHPSLGVDADVIAAVTSTMGELLRS